MDLQRVHAKQGMKLQHQTMRNIHSNVQVSVTGVSNGTLKEFIADFDYSQLIEFLQYEVLADYKLLLGTKKDGEAKTVAHVYAYIDIELYFRYKRVYRRDNQLWT